MTTILCGLPAFQPMHQPGFPAPDAGDKKFNSRLVAPTMNTKSTSLPFLGGLVLARHPRRISRRASA